MNGDMTTKAEEPEIWLILRYCLLRIAAVERKREN